MLLTMAILRTELPFKVAGVVVIPAMEGN